MPLSYPEQQIIEELEKQFSDRPDHRTLAPLRRYAGLVVVSLMMLATILFFTVLIFAE
jgi:hypothetical protein